jgi:hypothetical protein
MYLALSFVSGTQIQSILDSVKSLKVEYYRLSSVRDNLFLSDDIESMRLTRVDEQDDSNMTKGIRFPRNLEIIRLTDYTVWLKIQKDAIQIVSLADINFDIAPNHYVDIPGFICRDKPSIRILFVSLVPSKISIYLLM